MVSEAALQRVGQLGGFPPAGAKRSFPFFFKRSFNAIFMIYSYDGRTPNTVD